MTPKAPKPYQILNLIRDFMSKNPGDDAGLGAYVRTLIRQEKLGDQWTADLVAYANELSNQGMTKNDAFALLKARNPSVTMPQLDYRISEGKIRKFARKNDFYRPLAAQYKGESLEETAKGRPL